MLLEITIAASMFVATTGIHASGMMFALHFTRAKGGALKARMRYSHILRVNGIVIAMFLVSLAEVLVWEVLYLAYDAIQGFEKAFYFSMVTFTRLGYGDIFLDERWRLLASFEAANGIIMFGWITAIVMSAIRHVYFSDQPGEHGDGAGARQ
jgi:hypothetical protein